MNGLPSPNIKPKPKIQNPMVVTANTMKFLERMLTQFFARHIPDSTAAKPRFMKNTRNAVDITHTVSMPTLISVMVSGGAAAGAASDGAVVPPSGAGASAGAAAAGSLGS